MRRVGCFPDYLRFSGLNILYMMFITGILAPALFPSVSSAIPAFARKYDLSCTSCHTKPPRLNAFGEAFHMAGFQIPATEEGEIRKKRKIGKIFSDSDFLDLFSVRVSGSLAEALNGSDPSETNLVFPQQAEIYFAGTLTQEISYFFELENETKEIEGKGADQFEEKSRFGLGKEFFLMINLGSFWKSGFGQAHQPQEGVVHEELGKQQLMIMGPMMMIGKIDPSTNFSYPTNRQFILNIAGRADSGMIRRFGLTPYAFASKFFGMKTGQGDSVEVTREVLYNTTGDFGADLHFMLGNFLVQAGLLQGLNSGPTDENQKKDPYLMARMNFGGARYLSGSLSGLAYWGNDTGRVSRTDGSADTVLIDWIRYGVAGNLKYRLLDIYGAIIWDRVRDLPEVTRANFDDEAFGLTVEGDYLASDHLLLSLRYDQLNAGGFINRRAHGKVLSLQARYYLRDNLAFYLRDSYNLKGRNTGNPLQNFQNLAAVGIDLDF